MLLSWHLDAQQIYYAASACHTMYWSQRQRCQLPITFVSRPLPRQLLLRPQVRIWKRATGRCLARSTGSSDRIGDENEDSSSMSGSIGNNNDSTGSSIRGSSNSWDNWGFRFGLGRSNQSESSEEENARKIRQEEWERWQRSWSESEHEDSSWSEEPVSDQDNKVRYPREIDPIRGPRDAYLRPMIDARGVRQRLAFKSQVGEDELRSEFGANQDESRQAVSFAAVLIGIPLVTGFCVSRLLAEPVFHVYDHFSPNAFALNDRQKIEGAELVHKEELRLQMDVAIGKHPPLSDDQLQERLRKEARHLRDEFREENKKALLNILSDSITFVMICVILATSTAKRRTLMQTIGRVFGGLSDTAKAFLIIASTDILLGYHSEEGWTAAIHLLFGHYGAEPNENGSHLFVATIPVILDSIFKYWIFVGLNRKDPAATVTLKSMDRH